MTTYVDWRDAPLRVLKARAAGGGLFEPRVAYGSDGNIVAYVPSGIDAELVVSGGETQGGITAEKALRLEGSPVERLVRCAGRAIAVALAAAETGARIEVVVAKGDEAVAACCLALARRERSDLQFSVTLAPDAGAMPGLRRCLQNLGLPAATISAGASGHETYRSWIAVLRLTAAEVRMLAEELARHGGLVPSRVARA